MNSSSDCPDFDESGQEILNNLSFYLEGVVQTPVAIIGVLGNILSSLILASKEMRNSFNLMLIALAIFDSGYLFGSILESFRKCFNLGTWLHKKQFPHLLFPGKHSALGRVNIKKKFDFAKKYFRRF
jgi:hypothetical protein